MRRNKQLGMECLECRELLTTTLGPGLYEPILPNEFESGDVSAVVDQPQDRILASPDVYVSQVTDQEIIDALNNGTQVTISGGTVTGNVQRFDASGVDVVFAEAGDSTGAAARATRDGSGDGTRATIQLENATVAGSRFASPQAGSSFRPDGIPTFDGPQFGDID